MSTVVALALVDRAGGDSTAQHVSAACAVAEPGTYRVRAAVRVLSAGDYAFSSPARGDDRAAQRLVDGGVDHLFERFTPPRAHVLAHPVEDHDRVVHRVAGDGQNGGHDVQRQVVAEERQEAKVTRRSWNVAAMAPIAKLGRNRTAM